MTQKRGELVFEDRQTDRQTDRQYRQLGYMVSSDVVDVKRSPGNDVGVPVNTLHADMSLPRVKQRVKECNCM